MSDLNPHLELLALTHTLQSTSRDLQATLAGAINNTTDGTITIPIAVASTLCSVLRIEGKMLLNQMEQNMEIVDKVDDLIHRLEGK